MQNDFEKWLSVMLKQTSASSNAGMNSTLNTSVGGAGFNPASTDKKVTENLEAFYRARN